MKLFKELGKNGIKSFILLTYKLIIQIICKNIQKTDITTISQPIRFYLCTMLITNIILITNLSTLNIISQREPSYAVGGNVNWCCYYRKHIEVPKNLKIELPYDPKIPLLGIQTRL